ncbi:MAG: MgtC/SapB family protein [Rhizobiaceae bacterium]|jgi:uncharacterized membrane protein (DUF4010 family)|nr:MgtC/SapB family protein [Rhizobiaceae bacterium]
MIEEQAGRLGLALAIGLLVGLERGWRERDEPDHSRTAGLRTYGISSLFGGLLATLGGATGSSLVLAAGLAVFAAIFAAYKLREAIADDDYSVTGVIAGLCVFALGALAVAGDYRLAAGAGVALTALLASREALHSLLRRMTWEELRAALVLAAMTAIVLPVLPDRPIDPWGGVNPREIWLFTILVAALSFAGYVAIRVFDRSRGLLIGSLLGAIVSSTAVTVALARRVGESPSAMAGAASMAAAVSVLRVQVIVAITAPQVLPYVVLPGLAAALVFLAAGWMLVFQRNNDAMSEAGLSNPFDLGPLLAFAAAFAVIAGASAYLRGQLGDAGMLTTSVVAGVFDVDVAVLTAVRQEGELATAGDAVLLALLANAAGRAALGSLAGRWRFAVRYCASSAAAALAGAIAYLA